MWKLDLSNSQSHRVNKAFTRSRVEGEMGHCQAKSRDIQFWESEVLHAACSVFIYLKFAQRGEIQCTHRWKCNLLHYNNYSAYESITRSLCTQYVYTIFCQLLLSKAGMKKRVGRCFAPLNGAQSRLHVSFMRHFAYPCFVPSGQRLPFR